MSTIYCVSDTEKIPSLELLHASEPEPKDELDASCPICGSKTFRNFGSNTCSKSCWAELYGEDF